MNEYLIEVKKHYDSTDKELKMVVGLKHFQEFVLKFDVPRYDKLAFPFIEYLNGSLELDELINKIN